MSITEAVQAIPTGIWKSDPVHSSLGFAVQHMGVSPFRGTASDFEAILRDGDELVVPGVLTLKGVSLPVELRGTITGPLADPYGQQRVGIELETTIDRTDFGIDWNADLPSGGKVLADDVELTARLELVQEA